MSIWHSSQYNCSLAVDNDLTLTCQTPNSEGSRCTLSIFDSQERVTFSTADAK